MRTYHLVRPNSSKFLLPMCIPLSALAGSQLFVTEIVRKSQAVLVNPFNTTVRTVWDTIQCSQLLLEWFTVHRRACCFCLYCTLAVASLPVGFCFKEGAVFSVQNWAIALILRGKTLEFFSSYVNFSYMKHSTTLLLYFFTTVML